MEIIPKKQSKISKFFKTPIKLLTKARDFYVKGMNEYSDRIGMASVIGCPASGQVGNSLPRSYSVNSSKSSDYDEDYRELLRVASTRGLNNRIQLDLQQRQQQQQQQPKKIPRSFSVGIGRIDEEKACDFDDEIQVKHDVFTRSRSYAVGSTRATINGVA